MKPINNIIVISLLNAVLLAGHHDLSAAEAAPQPKAVFEDRFEEKLGPGWIWLREDPKTWRLGKKALEIRVEPGLAETVKNALVRPAPDRTRGKFAIEVTVTNTAKPTNQYEQAGITWYIGGKPVFKLVHEFIDGKLYVVPGKVPMEGDRVQLRLVVSGEDWTAQFRAGPQDGFKTAATGKLPPAAKDRKEEVSLQCYQGPPDAEHWMRFEEFRILELPAEPATAGNWPHWRGPTGNGISTDAEPPISWSPEKNIAWKAAVPGRGTASPVVWGSQVFVATAVSLREARKDELAPHRFILLAYDREDGKLLWERTAIEATPAEGHHPDHGFASASPFTDGERVYAHFGSRGLFAFSLKGEPVWQRTDFGPMKTRMGFGEGSSPALHGDSIVVPWDHDGPSWLSALDRRTGKTIWKKDRDEASAWGTPLVVDHEGKAQVITTGEKFARGHDLATGEELWRCSGQTNRPVASPVAGHGLAIVGSGFRGSYLAAFRLDARGDLKGTGGVAWSVSKHTPDIPSPLLSGKRVYFHAGKNGILSCHDLVSGKPHYTGQRIEGLANVYASPVGAAGRIYLTGRDGTTVTIEDADQLKVLATSSVGEPVDATPALAGKALFIRGSKHLFAIRG